MNVGAIYRVSTEKQLKRDEPDAIPVQRSAVREFIAARPEWRLVREYSEEGVSGFKVSAADRDVLQQALEDARRGAFQALVVFKADRLSRNALEYPVVLDRFRRLGCEVWSVSDGPGGKLLALDTQMDKFIRFLEGWQAETESQNTSIRVSAAMLKMAREGRWTGGPPPFGFRLNPARRPRSAEPSLVVDEGQAAVIRKMLGLYLEERMGCGRIAAVLNREGVPHPSGLPWDGQRVRRILQNPIIAGLPAYGRVRPVKRAGLQAPEGAREPQVLDRFVLPRDEAGNLRPVPGYQIVPLERWLRLWEAMLLNRRQPSAGEGARLRPARGLLAGLLVCGHCGARLVAGTGTGRRRYYACSTHLKTGRDRCDGQRTYGAQRLEQAVLSQVRVLLEQADPAALQEALEAESERARAASVVAKRRLEGDLGRAERVLAGWLERLEAQMAGDLAGAYSEELIAARIRTARARRDELKHALQQVSAPEAEGTEENATWLAAFDSASPETRRLLFHDLLERIAVRRDRLELEFRIDLRRS